jgi:transposase
VQRIHAVFFHQGAPRLGEGTLRTAKGLAELRAAAAAHLSPAGQLQVATARDMLACLEARQDAVRRHLLAAARHLAGAKALSPPGSTGSGRSPRWRCPAGSAGQAGSPPPARRSGSPGWTSPSTPPTAGAPPGTCPGKGPVLRWAVYEAGKTHARASAPDHAAVASRKNTKRAALSEARKIIRQACHILAERGDDALTAA